MRKALGKRGGQVEKELNFYSHEQVSDRLVLVTEGYSMVHRFTIGVVIGDEKILVIDAGLGGGSGLRPYIEGITGTGKTMICAATHNHPDHMGSAKNFDEAYVSWLDYPARNDFSLNREQRLEDLKGFALDNEEVQRYCSRHMIDNRDTECLDIKDGDVFDLGGVVIRAIWLPGHSEGSMAFYNHEEGYVFTGDSVNTDVHLKKLDREGMIRYQTYMKRFVDLVAPDTVVYPAHLPLAMDMKIAENLISAAEDLIQGRNLEQDPPGETIFAGRNNNPDIRMHFCNNTCIVYNREKIKEKPVEKGGQDE
ncbi:MBL fold metallo-hydrolase [Clostridium sp. MCC353]|uniref:MBL fold metallo-hydrolase n=1 Tax=Clostridium sp. MCC353 TaxID=2592646 RepID=UPI001C009FEE|nr:MBL fold metallo-hydrolase [Clostridium sp. MCC353]MBT9777799.1 MBL fold metallo-hydrolase [Clostridium sp. MCC353]